MPPTSRSKTAETTRIEQGHLQSMRSDPQELGANEVLEW